VQSRLYDKEKVVISSFYDLSIHRQFTIDLLYVKYGDHSHLRLLRNTACRPLHIAIYVVVNRFASL